MLWPTEPRTTVCGVEQVLQLQYRVRWLSDDVSVRNDAAPVTVQLAGFSCSLSGETARENPVHGRAYGKAEGAAGPLTEAEVKRLEAVTPRLIRRAAEYEAKVPSLPQITMADLPPLSD